MLRSVRQQDSQAYKRPAINTCEEFLTGRASQTHFMDKEIEAQRGRRAQFQSVGEQGWGGRGGSPRAEQQLRGRPWGAFRALGGLGGVGAGG